MELMKISLGFVLLLTFICGIGIITYSCMERGDTCEQFNTYQFGFMTGIIMIVGLTMLGETVEIGGGHNNERDNTSQTHHQQKKKNQRTHKTAKAS